MPFYYIKDVLGNITEIVDSNGIVVVSYNYDAWGNMQTVLNYNYTLAYNESINYTATDITEINSHYYRDYYYDKETGFYYLTTRYYDPEIGGFISPDDPRYLDYTIAYGHNRYAYCVNNPIYYVDSCGRKPKINKKNTTGEVSASITLFHVPIYDDAVWKASSNNIIMNVITTNGTVITKPVFEGYLFTYSLSVGSLSEDSFTLVDAGASLAEGHINITGDVSVSGSICEVGVQVLDIDLSDGDFVLIDVAGAVATVGVHTEYVTAEVSFLTFGITAGIEQGKLSFGLGFGWFGFNFSIKLW